jgi:hypothetical protein
VGPWLVGQTDVGAWAPNLNSQLALCTLNSSEIPRAASRAIRDAAPCDEAKRGLLAGVNAGIIDALLNECTSAQQTSGKSGEVGECSRVDSSGLIKSSGRICRRCSFCRGTGLLTGTVTA